MVEGAAKVMFRSLLLCACSQVWATGCQSDLQQRGLPSQMDATGGAAALDGSANVDAVSTDAATADAGTTDAAKADGDGADSAVLHPVDAAASPDHDGQVAGNADAGVAGAARKDLRCVAAAQVAQRTDYARPGPHAVGTMEVTFEDDSRPIEASDKHPAAPSRKLLTTLYYPASAQASSTGPTKVASGGPFPMLMYSHGYSSSRAEATGTAKRAASYGYIVVAPDFPLTNLLANGAAPDVDDVTSQPGDVSYLIDRLLAFSKDPNHLLANAVDETRIGALGVSLGGLTTLLVSFHPRFHDPRIKAAMPIAALSSFFAQGFYHTREIPLLLVHGDLDAFVNYQTNARRAFERAAPNARLVTVAKGTHAAFGAEFDPSLLPALNALLGAPGADPSNPDGIGCGAVGETLNMSGGGFLGALGGAEDFISANEATLPPCRGDEYKRPAMNPIEQAEIMARAAPAFFDAHLAKGAETRQDGCRYVLYELPKNPAVKIE